VTNESNLRGRQLGIRDKFVDLNIEPGKGAYQARR
jgi:hypothetical protein